MPLIFIILLIVIYFNGSIKAIDTSSQFLCSPNIVVDNVAVFCTFLPQLSNAPVGGSNFPSSNIKVIANGTLNGISSTLFGPISLLDDSNTYSFRFLPTYSDNFTLSLTISGQNVTFYQNVVVYSIPDQSSLLTCNSSVFIGSIVTCTIQVHYF